jgi:hypothetical protein
VQPYPRQAPTALALIRRGLLKVEPDGLRVSATEAGRHSIAAELGPRCHNERLVKNWERAREKRRANVGR